MIIRDICESFDIGGEYLSCTELSTGNINSTYHVRYLRDGEKKDYIVQHINSEVFKEPERVMDNIVNVTDYVRRNIKKLNLPTRRFVLRVFTTKESGKPYFIDNFGNYWRVYRYIKDSVTYDCTNDLGIIERAGQAFGRFQNCLDGFDATKLYVTIPNFHNTPSRYKALHEAVAKDCCGRVSEIVQELEKLLSFEKQASLLQDYLDKELIPLRVTHNDTKCNNVTFDKNTGEALAVLDLDTVMPGAIAYDFGDAIRFIANFVLEDDPVTQKVGLDVDKYIAFTKGFVGEVKAKLTDLEKKTLNLGVFTMTVELAVRFLTDYINGDVYFKTKRKGHNLDRARNQIALAEDVLKKMPILDQIMQEYI